MDGLRCITHAQRFDHYNKVYIFQILTFSQGYLDIVRWLCEIGDAAGIVNGVPGVDLRSKGGWTPLSTCFNIHVVILSQSLL